MGRDDFQVGMAQGRGSKGADPKRTSTGPRTAVRRPAAAARRVGPAGALPRAPGARPGWHGHRVRGRRSATSPRGRLEKSCGQSADGPGPASPSSTRPAPPRRLRPHCAGLCESDEESPPFAEACAAWLQRRAGAGLVDRRRAWGCSAQLGAGTIKATSRRSCGSSAANTMPMPPRPSTRSTRSPGGAGLLRQAGTASRGPVEVRFGSAPFEPRSAPCPPENHHAPCLLPATESETGRVIRTASVIGPGGAGRLEGCWADRIGRGQQARRSSVAIASPTLTAIRSRRAQCEGYLRACHESAGICSAMSQRPPARTRAWKSSAFSSSRCELKSRLRRELLQCF